MFTANQLAILKILVGEPDRSFSMSEVGRLLGKAPGVFQRGLNALENEGFVVSRRRGNLRLLSITAARPFGEATEMIIGRASSPLPADVYLTHDPSSGHGASRVAEPHAIYATSKLKLLIIAGPNGAGKTTFAREFLPQEADCHLFINADYIAHGLSPFSPERAAMKAGKLMLRELDDHIAHRRNIAIETTLSGRRYARLIPRWQKQGYAVKLIFLSLPSVELALARVAGRVRQGGHSIPEQTIRRRFEAGRLNFDRIYQPLVDAWAFYDNSGNQPILLEEKE
jgi:predicted ABC-type ATPase/DNA-binding transcriptional ArsR family regulator